MLESNVQNLMRQWLDETGHTQKELAEAAGMSASQINRLINSNSKQIDIATVNALRSVMKFSKDDIFIETKE